MDEAETSEQVQRVASKLSLPPSRRSVSFVGSIHPDADYYNDPEREPLLTRDGQKRTKRRLTALLNNRRRFEDEERFYHEDKEPRSWLAVLGIVFGVLAFLFVIIAAGIAVAQNPIPGSGPHHPSNNRHPSYLIHAARGAVASESETCSRIGVDILREGGSAVDAAIAATICIGVINMFSSGIGGGGFLTVKLPGEEAWTIDFREAAPSGSNSTMFLKDPPSSVYGGLSIGVPGELRGLALAHRHWGKLPWKRLFHESIKLAEGFTVSRILEDRLDTAGEWMVDDPDWAPIFAPNGYLARRGDRIQRLNYSKTLRAIAEEGPDAFYMGPIADSIIKKIQATGGIMTHKDLASYTPVLRPALEGTYHGGIPSSPRRVFTTHAPTSGPIVLFILNLLEHYSFIGEGFTPLNVHRIVEALKFGFATRTRLCDPAFTNGTNHIDDIPTKEYADAIFPNLTDDTTHKAAYYHPIFDIPDDHGTTHTSVLDNDGMAVALTSTINLVFGSRVMDPATGVIFNDEMDDFSKPGFPNAFGLYPSPFNYPAPGKRPVSSTAPTILTQEDGTFFLALGGSGGSMIFPSIVHVILNVDWGMDIRDAIEAPRVFDQLFPQTVIVETSFPPIAIEGLRQRGHNITMFDILQAFAAVQGVMQRDDLIMAASDSRKWGVAAGY